MASRNGTMSGGRRPLRAHASVSGRGQKAPLGARIVLRDGLLLTAIAGLVGVSLVPGLQGSEFAPRAPIELAATPEADRSVAEAVQDAQTEVSGSSITEVASAIDPSPVGSLREGGEPEPLGESGGSGGMKVIEVPPSTPPAGSGIVISNPLDQRQPLRVAHLPDRSLIDSSDDGPLPISAQGRRPLDVYAGQWSGRRGNRIAIVVGGLGISQTGTAEAIEKLPGKVTLAFSPAGNSLKRWLETARRQGHELLLQVPMQRYEESGSGDFGRRLTVDASPTENARRLRRSLGRMTNYVGVMNYTGAAFTAEPKALAPIMAEIRDRGLLYVDDGTIGQSQAEIIARQQAQPFAAGDVLLDAQRDEEAIEAQLAKLEEIASGTGHAVGVATAFPESVAAISDWLKSVESRGFEVVPISAIARDPGRR